MSEHKACPSHCCPIHGCKYGHEDCPIVTEQCRPIYGKNNGCECCETDAADPKNIEIASLRGVIDEANRLMELDKDEIESLRQQLADQTQVKDDAIDDVRRLHGEKRKFFERTIELEQQLAAAQASTELAVTMAWREAVEIARQTGDSFTVHNFTIPDTGKSAAYRCANAIAKLSPAAALDKLVELEKDAAALVSIRSILTSGKDASADYERGKIWIAAGLPHAAQDSTNERAAFQNNAAINNAKEGK